MMDVECIVHSTSPDPVSSFMLLELERVEEKEWRKGNEWRKGWRRVLVKMNVRGGASSEYWVRPHSGLRRLCRERKGVLKEKGWERYLSL